ncbi:bifunctional acetate--CoA ligase family protein/GNAT family N-acetyltransferase [Cupriavidus gilardii]|uniref:bifunctional acetate--CoA ligase family protein/GNAT family N-acetyltransferase n=1 Tax=Cupriavidus gilardii TaxID=82541 RepID=UPI001EE52A75|nr:bifunctional acetate--CoA ligase family protein/GNAT family N-acetyltransferase [Cupriavidus gilardii]MCG5262760.1 bifunctional acetate--CoA ligase family protein/GNAT family N-acetyltransferase [Cupriavidus gilardii]
MSTRNLEHLFRPESIAVIGASRRPGSIGAAILANLMESGFAGPVYPVNPKYDTLAGRPCYRNVAALPQAPELGVICTPAESVPKLVEELGRKGTRAVVVVTAGPPAEGGQRAAWRQAILDASRPYLLRVLGPNCVGLMVPRIGLHASFATGPLKSGPLAFATQSGALATAVLDWSRSRDIGFSHFVSLGDSADIDVADVLDYLATDASTRAILLYVEAVRDGRKFLSAARAAARSKPVVIVKAGRVPDGARAAASHTGALAGADDVWDAVIRRAGLLRVTSTEQLFDAVETLARGRPLAGERLCIITNGGGAGVLATDALVLSGGTLATLGVDTIAALDRCLPAGWSRGNPVDIVGDADAGRYANALAVVSHASDVDAVLTIHAPTALVLTRAVAQTIIDGAAGATHPLLACWLGGDDARDARLLCQRAGIPAYAMPEQAIRGFLQLVEFQRNQRMLLHVPSAAEAEDTECVDSNAARAVIETALREGTTMLDEARSKRLLKAYGIPVVETEIARDPIDAAEVASRIGFPVALKIRSPDLTHKSSVGGVALDLASSQEVRAVATRMLERIGAIHPGARLDGFTVQRMAGRPGARELIVGIATDPVFGPVVLFGQGGTAVERIGDRSIGLPPLNEALASQMVDSTRVARVLGAYAAVPAADRRGILRVLIRIARMACELPEVTELDINPLIADESGVLALDARVGIRPASGRPTDRLSILPYPTELVQTIDWNGHTLLLRPIRPDDAVRYAAFVDALSEIDAHRRFYCAVHRPADPTHFLRWTQLDYARDMTFVAVLSPDAAHGRGNSAGKPAVDEGQIIGEARLAADPDGLSAEFAIAVRSDLQHRGLGTLLLKMAIAYARTRGLARLVGTTLPDNAAMLALATACGFTVARAAPAANGWHLRLDLD